MTTNIGGWVIPPPASNALMTMPEYIVITTQSDGKKTAITFYGEQTAMNCYEAPLRKGEIGKKLFRGQLMAEKSQ